MANNVIWSPAGERTLLLKLKDKTDFYSVIDPHFIEGFCVILYRLWVFMCGIVGNELEIMDVLENLESLRNRYRSFHIFLRSRFVHYNLNSNRVWVDVEYLFNEETKADRERRKGGEPLFRILKLIFEDRRMDRLDFEWLCDRFRGIPRNWLREPRVQDPWPYFLHQSEYE